MYPHMRRCPEPAAMESPSSVEAFHAEGESTGALRSIYHFNALAMSRLLPRGATVVDLGCGSAQYLLYLAQCRPDIQVVGLDLSEAMVRLGNRSLERAGFAGRVRLHIADMTHFKHQIPDSVDLISSVFALHHLPTTENLLVSLKEIAAIASETGCAVWLFDHVRPRCVRTAEEFPVIFTPQASSAFQQDSRNSLCAAFSFREVCSLLDQNSSVAWNHARSRLLRLYQVHWVGPSDRQPHSGHELFVRQRLTVMANQEFRQLRRILEVPLVDIA